jgi:uncharacterized protein (DUF433 family)
MNQLLQRITINPDICFGKPCIEYPQLTHEDVLAAIAYGAEVSRERIVPVPTERAA